MTNSIAIAICSYQTAIAIAYLCIVNKIRGWSSSFKISPIKLFPGFSWALCGRRSKRAGSNTPAFTVHRWHSILSQAAMYGHAWCPTLYSCMGKNIQHPWPPETCPTYFNVLSLWRSGWWVWSAAILSMRLLGMIAAVRGPLRSSLASTTETP